MGRPVILAGASVRSLAESAIADGFAPWCVDMFGDADLRQRLQQQGCPEPTSIEHFADLPAAVQGIPAAAPLVWAGGLENHPGVLNQLSRTARVCGHSSERLADVRSQQGLCSVVAGTGCQVPGGADGDSADRQGRWLIKSTHSSGGIGIRFFDGRPLKPHEYLQQYISGMAVSALYCRDQQSVRVLGTCGQIIGEHGLGGQGFAFCGNVGPIRLSNDIQSLIVEIGRRLGERGCVGVYGADFVISSDDVWLIEVNPRITASHEIYDCVQSGPGVLRQHLEALGVRPATDAGQSAGGSPVLPQQLSVSSDRAILARLIVYAGRDFLITESQVETLLGLCRSCAQQQTWLADVPMAGQIMAGQPFCSVYHMLKQGDSAWVPGDPTLAAGVDGLLAGMAGTPDLNTAFTAVRHASLFESVTRSDNTPTFDLPSSQPG